MNALKGIITAAAIVSTVATASAYDFNITPIQPPDMNSVPMIPTPAPAPPPKTDGWVRPIPIPDNPGFIGGVRHGNTDFNFTVREHGYQGEISTKIEIPGS
ncbi:hypothetical protein [Roseibium aggregatum]|uniref:hypothetical protein n=1 Tax=Roseibium aggregatum TaxID=187304 RepID=UPI0025AB93E0|nr:hypothetical protein [Roseibium aggregatum]WJS05500.1 hypothetical protein QUB73_27155 [Roseibium aggregatum]